MHKVGKPTYTAKSSTPLETSGCPLLNLEHFSWICCLFFFALLHDIMISLTKNLDLSAKGHSGKLK